MFEKNMRMSYLMDFYGDLLDEHISSVMRAYYYDDLSLSEIASDEGISRQGIRHLVKKGEEMLEFYDSRLHLVARHEELTSACEELEEIASHIGTFCEHIADADKIRRIIKTITKGS